MDISCLDALANGLESSAAYACLIKKLLLAQDDVGSALPSTSYGGFDGALEDMPKYGGMRAKALRSTRSVISQDPSIEVPLSVDIITGEALPSQVWHALDVEVISVGAQAGLPCGTCTHCLPPCTTPSCSLYKGARARQELLRSKEVAA